MTYKELISLVDKNFYKSTEEKWQLPPHGPKNRQTDQIDESQEKVQLSNKHGRKYSISPVVWENN